MSRSRSTSSIRLTLLLLTLGILLIAVVDDGCIVVVVVVVVVVKLTASHHDTMPTDTTGKDTTKEHIPPGQWATFTLQFITFT